MNEIYVNAVIHESLRNYERTVTTISTLVNVYPNHAHYAAQICSNYFSRKQIASLMKQVQWPFDVS